MRARLVEFEAKHRVRRRIDGDPRPRDRRRLREIERAALDGEARVVALQRGRACDHVRGNPHAARLDAIGQPARQHATDPGTQDRRRYARQVERHQRDRIEDVDQIWRPCSSRNGPKLTVGAMPVPQSGTEWPRRFERNAVSRLKITGDAIESAAVAGVATASAIRSANVPRGLDLRSHRILRARAGSR